MWAAIKKALNSNLAKPLDILLGEQYNSVIANIGNTWAKANEANGNAWNSLQKGQEIVNMMNDTGGKKYTIVRQGTIDYNQRFDYAGGAGVLRSVSATTDDIRKVNIYVDGQPLINFDWYAVSSEKTYQYRNSNHPIFIVSLQIEFKNSISIVSANGSRIQYLIQTEK